MGDQPTAVLTKGQREYLQGDREPTQERTMKTRVRDRVRASLYDLELILDALANGILSVEDLSIMIEGTDPDDPIPMWTLPALLFVATQTTDTQTIGEALFGGNSPPEVDRRCRLFDRAVESGVTEALVREDHDRAINDIDNTLSVEFGPELSELRNEDLPALPRDHLDQLLKEGKIDEETYVEAVKERFDRIESGDTEDMGFRSP